MVTIARKISIRKPVALLPFGKKTGRRLFPSVVDSGFDLRLLATQAAKIEQFRSSDFTSADNINCLYVGRMDGPCLLNTDAVGDLPDGESSPGAAALDLDDSTFEDLYSLSGTFLDAVVNANGVACCELRNLSLQLLFFQLFDDFEIHNDLLSTPDVLACTAPEVRMIPWGPASIIAFLFVKRTQLGEPYLIDRGPS